MTTDDAIAEEEMYTLEWLYKKVKIAEGVLPVHISTSPSPDSTRKHQNPWQDASQSEEGCHWIPSEDVSPPISSAPTSYRKCRRAIS